MKIIFVFALSLVHFGIRAQDTKKPLDERDSLKTLNRTGDSAIYRNVELSSSYLGGEIGWKRFLSNTLRYPPIAEEKSIQGTVNVQFIVDKMGKVSDVHAISGPEELRWEAERLIKKSGLWTPAVVNGKSAVAYKIQPIDFKLNYGNN